MAIFPRGVQKSGFRSILKIYWTNMLLVLIEINNITEYKTE
jgi:hypothetical protein